MEPAPDEIVDAVLITDSLDLSQNRILPSSARAQSCSSGQAVPSSLPKALIKPQRKRCSQPVLPPPECQRGPRGATPRASKRSSLPSENSGSSEQRGPRSATPRPSKRSSLPSDDKSALINSGSEEQQSPEPHLPRSHGKTEARKNQAFCPRLEEVPERPQKPAEVMHMRKIAQARTDELQEIFESRHSEASDRLRARLGKLTDQGNQLRLRIATLERELQEATSERTKNVRADRASNANEAEEKLVLPSTSQRNSRCVAEIEKLSESVSDHLLEASTTTAPSDSSSLGAINRRESSRSNTSMHEVKSPVAASKELQVSARLSVETPTSKHVRSPQPLSAPDAEGWGLSSMRDAEAPEDPMSLALIDHEEHRVHFHSSEKSYQDQDLRRHLVRRRAEAKFEEASVVHEFAISEMKTELQEIERRMVKQQNWMRHVQDEILKVEHMKAHFEVRLEHARKRVTTLGTHLSEAYEHMARLMEDRMEVEEYAARNSGLVWYLHLLEVADYDNATKFVQNRSDVLAFNHQIKKMRETRAKLDFWFEQVRSSQLLAQDIVNHSDELTWLSEQLQLLWNMIPVDWKDSVFKSVQKGLSSPLAMHPVNAIQVLQSTSKSTSSSMKFLLRDLSEFMNHAITHTNRRKAFDGSISRARHPQIRKQSTSPPRFSCMHH